MSPAGGHDASGVSLPFEVGERLEYDVAIPRFRGRGTASMSVSGVEVVRGRETWVLEFLLSARAAFSPVSDHSTSWLDPERMATRRFHKRERSPLGKIDIDVEVLPEERRWTGADGQGGTSPSETPLDELSFFYFVRTLPLEEGMTHTLEHHFDPSRNPVIVRGRGRGRSTVPAGTFETLEVEMEVLDPARFGGGGHIRLHLTEDAHRVPVRIESSLPVAGAMILSLESPAQE